MNSSWPIIDLTKSNIINENTVVMGDLYLLSLVVFKSNELMTDNMNGSLENYILLNETNIGKG